MAVVDEQYGDGQAELGERRQLLDVHLERAVAAYAEDAAAGVGERRAYGGRKAEPHGAQAARREEDARLAKGYACAAHIWCCPTSVQTIVPAGAEGVGGLMMSTGWTPPFLRSGAAGRRP